jgi:hypothetical protein
MACALLSTSTSKGDGWEGEEVDMLFAPIAFLLIAFVSGGLCLANLPVPADNVVRELSASSLAFSAILAIAYRSFLAQEPRKTKGD